MFTCLLGVCDLPSLGDLDWRRSGDSQSAWVPRSSELQRETSGERRCFLSLDRPLSLPPERWVSDLWPVEGDKKTTGTYYSAHSSWWLQARDHTTVNWSWSCPFRIQDWILTSRRMGTNRLWEVTSSGKQGSYGISTQRHLACHPCCLPCEDLMRREPPVNQEESPPDTALILILDFLASWTDWSSLASSGRWTDDLTGNEREMGKKG